MVARTSSETRSTAHGELGSRYDRMWRATTIVAAVAWVAVAIAQSPTVPLLALVIELAAIGGTVFVRAPVPTPEAQRQYAAGALGVAAAVLVAVGIGHHFETGLAMAAVLGGSSPSLIRWVGGA